MDPIAEAFIDDVRWKRHEMGISQEQLARRTNSTRCTIQRIESGTVEPRLSLALRIAKKLDLTLTDYI